MPYDLANKLVIGLASSALFDLSESDAVFRNDGEKKYRKYQRDKENIPLKRGVAFPFIRRLLSLNQINDENHPVEIILLSRNDPDTGLRVMNSIRTYNLDITRAMFLQGRSPHRYIQPLSISLFLSENPIDVKQAINAGYPAGQVLKSRYEETIRDRELRIAFDFDGVIANDESEQIYQAEGMASYHQHEYQLRKIAHKPGPLKEFLQKLSKIQQMELEFSAQNPSYMPKIRISVVTARNAPSHERAINTLRDWGIMVNEAFFLGGIDKSSVLQVISPHIFFDDQASHLTSACNVTPSVLVPFGKLNNSASSK